MNTNTKTEIAVISFDLGSVLEVTGGQTDE